MKKTIYLKIFGNIFFSIHYKKYTKYTRDFVKGSEGDIYLVYITGRDEGYLVYITGRGYTYH
jgi:hypothetical protein